MSVTRDELHQLVDAVDDEKVPEAAAYLRALVQRGASSVHHMSFVGSLKGGPEDLAEQHGDYLRGAGWGTMST